MITRSEALGFILQNITPPKLPTMIGQPSKIPKSLRRVKELNRFADTVQVKSNFRNKKSSWNVFLRGNTRKEKRES